MFVCVGKEKRTKRMKRRAKAITSVFVQKAFGKWRANKEQNGTHKITWRREKKKENISFRFFRKKIRQKRKLLQKEKREKNNVAIYQIRYFYCFAFNSIHRYEEIESKKKRSKKSQEMKWNEKNIKSITVDDNHHHFLSINVISIDMKRFFFVE